MTFPLVVAGHSHIGALIPPPPTAEKPTKAIPQAIKSPTLLAIENEDAAILTGPMPRDDIYWAALEEAARIAIPVILWEGDQHLAFLLEPAPPFDFVLAGAPDLPMDPRASYVAEAHLRAFFAPSFEPLGRLIARLSRASGGPVLIGGTPPPFGNVDRIRAQIAVDPRFAGAAEIDLATAAINSPYTMQKLWSLLQTMAGETAMAAGAVFVPVPDRVRGDDGFLMEIYAGTGLSANADYGREMLAELIDAARDLPSFSRTAPQ